MKFLILSPIKMYICDANDEEMNLLKKALTFLNKNIEYQIKMIRHNSYKYSPRWVGEKLQALEEQKFETLLYTDNNGVYTRPGILYFLKNFLKKQFYDVNNIVVENKVVYPEFKLIPWDKPPAYSMLPHQKRAVDSLLKNYHGHIEYATGTGKSFIIMNLIKATGLPTAVTTPNVSIAKQLYEQAVSLFGKKNVGMFGGGKKQLDKHIMIAVGKSLGMLRDPKDLEEMKKYQVLISDESHTLPANTFEYFCHEVLGHCPYRWFLSGTQTRASGDDLKLKSIIGPRILSYSIQNAIDDGVLAKLKFFVFDVKSNSTYNDDVNIVRMNQEHFYNNEKIAKIISDLAEDALLRNKPTLILVDEHAQEKLLRKYMKVDYAYACAETDVHQIVKDFNEGKIMTVVGTSAVSVGTDFKPVQLTINWQGGKSPIKIKQGAIGRSTRLDQATGKNECVIVDFRITNVPILKRHANTRISYYKDIGTVEYILLDSF